MTNPNDPHAKDQSQKNQQDATRFGAPKSATPGEPQKGPGSAPIQIGQSKPADQRRESSDRDTSGQKTGERSNATPDRSDPRDQSKQNPSRDQGDATPSRSSQTSGKPNVSDSSSSTARKTSGPTDSARDDMGEQKSGGRPPTSGDPSSGRDLASQHPSRDQGDTSSSRSSQSGGKPVVSDPSRKTSGASDTQRDDSSAEGENTESDRLARGTDRSTDPSTDRSKDAETNEGGTSGGTNRANESNRPSTDKSGKPNRS